MRFVLAFLMCAAAAISPADRFDDFVKQAMDEQHIPGLQFAVVYKGRTVMSRAYGYAYLEKKAAVTPATPFEVASISKPVIATVVMSLFEQGKFKLDEPIGKYVAEIPAAWSRVSIASLLSHTSGVPEYRAGRFYAQKRMEETPFEEIAKNSKQELEFDLLDHFAYSNTNYLLLGKLIEKVTGKPYTDYVRGSVFDPLKMTASGFIGGKEHAQGYAYIGKEYLKARDCALAWAGPGASIVSTAEDMAKFDEALLTQKLVRNSSQNMMLAPTVTKLGSSDYGMGWQVTKSGRNTIAVHSGKMNGFSSIYLRLIEDRLSIIILTNAAEIDGNTLARGILSRYFPEMTPLDLNPIVDDEPETTVAHFKLLTDIIGGRADMSQFSEEYKLRATEAKLKAVGTELRRGGRVEPLKLLKRNRKGAFMVHSYLMVQGGTKLIYTVFVDSEGKIGGLTFAAP